MEPLKLFIRNKETGFEDSWSECPICHTRSRYWPEIMECIKSCREKRGCVEGDHVGEVTFEVFCAGLHVLEIHKKCTVCKTTIEAERTDLNSSNLKAIYDVLKDKSDR